MKFMFTMKQIPYFQWKPFELGLWEGKSEFICVPVGCYTISMGSAANGGWTDGSQLQILDDLTSDYFFLDIDQGNPTYN